MKWCLSACGQSNGDKPNEGMAPAMMRDSPPQKKETHKKTLKGVCIIKEKCVDLKSLTIIQEKNEERKKGEIKMIEGEENVDILDDERGPSKFTEENLPNPISFSFANQEPVEQFEVVSRKPWLKKKNPDKKLPPKRSSSFIVQREPRIAQLIKKPKKFTSISSNGPYTKCQVSKVSYNESSLREICKEIKKTHRENEKKIHEDFHYNIRFKSFSLLKKKHCLNDEINIQTPELKRTKIGLMEDLEKAGDEKMFESSFQRHHIVLETPKFNCVSGSSSKDRQIE